jgi:carboxypeptidase C (cathepsin A)
MNILSSLAIVPVLLSAMVCATDEKTPSPPAAKIAETVPTSSNDSSPFVLADQVVIDNRSISVDGTSIPYDIRAGALTVHGKDDKDVANVSYIAYFAHESTATAQRHRPIAFCFNGGPGSSSVWLHMGFLGPKTVDLKGMSHPPLPVGYKDNPQTLLCSCDLVFIDPVSTGFSTAVDKENPKKFHGVEEDLFSIADFIRLFLTKYHRWESPKLLIGESYGTLRAVGLASLLQDHYFIDINGLVLVSLVLDLQVLEESPTMDIPCITILPTLASIAHYHQQLHPPMSQIPVQKLVEEAKKFAVEEYGPALLQGSQISDEQKDRIAQRLSELTSLPASTISGQDLRISYPSFCDGFLKSQNRMIGRFDGRMTAYRVPNEPSASNEIMSYPDPSFYSVSGAFTSAFQAYLSNDLHWQKGEPYIVISDNVRPWNWTFDARPSAGCGYLSFMQDFRVAMVKNPTLKVFVAAGYYDLATPYFSQEYSLTHLVLPQKLQKNITLKGYEAGHMMYLDEPSRAALFKDLVEFVSTVERQQ